MAQTKKALGLFLVVLILMYILFRCNTGPVPTYKHSYEIELTFHDDLNRDIDTTYLDVKLISEYSEVLLDDEGGILRISSKYYLRSIVGGIKKYRVLKHDVTSTPPVNKRNNK